MLKRLTPFLIKPNSRFKPVLTHPNIVFRQNQSRAYGTPKLRIPVENSHAFTIIKPPVLNAPRNEEPSKKPEVVIATEEEFERFLNRNWSEKSIGEITSGFTQTLQFVTKNNINISDRRFDKLTQALLDKIEFIDKNQIIEMMSFLFKSPKCPALNSHNYHDIWSALDDMCCVNFKTWTFPEALEVAEHFYRLGLCRPSDFIQEILRKYELKPERLTTRELVHVFFYFNVARKHRVSFEYQAAVERAVAEMGPGEVGVVAMGFFKTDTKIKSAKTLNAMIDCMIENVESVHEISLAAVLKIVRKSDNPDTADNTVRLLGRLTSQMGRFSNPCRLHIALAGTGLQIFHPATLTTVAEKMSEHLSDPESVRLKDIERLLLPLTMFDFNPTITRGDVYELLAAELRNPARDEEKKAFPRCLPCALSYLTIRNIYLEDLISEVLDSKYRERVYGRRFAGYPSELYTLSCCVELERPEYKGNLLPMDLKQKIGKFTIEPLPDRTKKSFSSADRLFLDVADRCVEALGNDPEKVFCGHVLPHFVKADMVLCYDLTKREFVKPELGDYVVGTVVRAPSRPDRKYIVVVTVPVNVSVRYIKRPVGNVIRKVRQLRLLGYEPVFVSYHEYFHLDTKAKQTYLKARLNSILP